MFFVTGAEVGMAYDEQVAAILGHPELCKWKYVATIEDDTMPPADAILRLLESIEAGNFDGVSGLYWTKGDPGMQAPMAYGDPAEYARTGVLDFRPRDVMAAIQHGYVMPVNGIACGMSIYKMDLFKSLQRPWFKTLNDITPAGPVGMTQDLYLCEKARRIGKTFAVDMRVRCAHMDWASGVAY